MIHRLNKSLGYWFGKLSIEKKTLTALAVSFMIAVQITVLLCIIADEITKHPLLK